MPGAKYYQKIDIISAVQTLACLGKLQAQLIHTSADANQDETLGVAYAEQNQNYLEAARCFTVFQGS